MDGSEVKTCATITCEPNELVVRIHHRMGVILRDADIATWLQPGEVEGKELQPLLKSYPPEEMTFYQVAPIVSNARNDVPECVQEVPENPVLDFPH
jgi:putative SOS response-associated peptidase YedK